jgi:hypothetical protein
VIVILKYDDNVRYVSFAEKVKAEESVARAQLGRDVALTGAGVRAATEYAAHCSYLVTILLSLLTTPVWCPVQNKRTAPVSFFHGCGRRRLKD